MGSPSASPKQVESCMIKKRRERKGFYASYNIFSLEFTPNILQQMISNSLDTKNNYVTELFLW
jgi:hypothetical protein